MSSYKERWSELEVKDRIFLTITMFFIPWAIHFTLYVSEQNKELQETVANFPRLDEIPKAIWYALLLGVARSLLGRYIFQPLAHKVIAKSKYKTKEEFKLRQNRFGDVACKAVFFILVVHREFSLGLSMPWFPKALGGNGDLSLLWTDYPATPINLAIKAHYIFELGYHIHATFFHILVVDHRNDYMEMILHHFVTIFLITLSYLVNCLNVGFLVMIVHDVADIFVYIVKALVDGKWKYLTLLAYICMLISWGYCRLYVYPRYLVMQVYKFHDKGGPGFHIFFTMMIILYFLHWYWFGIFIKIGYHFFNKGEAVDMVQKVTSDDYETDSRQHGKNKLKQK